MKKIFMLLIALTAVCASAFAGCETVKPNAYKSDGKSAETVQEEQPDDRENDKIPADPEQREPRRKSDDDDDGCPHCRHREPRLKDGRNTPPHMPKPEKP